MSADNNMSSSAPPSSGGGGAGAAPPNANILSDKVQRALQVRTDTPAMKAALEALAHLPQQQQNTTTSSAENKEEEEEDDMTFVVDSRSVRVAIEQDALQQALMLQDELQTLVQTVATLRQGVTDTAAIADRLYHNIHTDVTVSLQKPPENQMLPPKQSSLSSSLHESSSHMNTTTSDEDGESGGGSAPSSNNNNNTSGSSLILEEAQLARTLHDAFEARDQAQQRLEVVQQFLDKFDLSESDARLLDQYQFEDVSLDSDQIPANGMAFLKALQRVVQIRQALGDTFGGTSTSSTGSTASSGDDSKHGLGTSSALRMMESLAQKQEQAYERLYHWLQHYLHLHPNDTPGSNQNQNDDEEYDRLDQILSHPFCQLALQTLQHVPAFYAHTLELIATARRSHATKQFLLALTSGVQGMPPLEMKAHDAVAYVGDMLAFCFRAYSVEADFAKQMKHLQDKVRRGDLSTGEQEQENKNDNDNEEEVDLFESPGQQPTLSAHETLSLTMSGVARPLKSRILQVVATLARSMNEQNAGGGGGDDDDDDDLESHDSLMDDLEDEGGTARNKVTQLYDICGLLLFYASAMESVQHKLDLPPGQASSRSLQAAPAEDKENDEDFEQSPLIKAVLECLGEATSSYEAAFRVYSAMMENLALISGHSEASLAHRLVVSIADCRVASPGYSQDVPCPTEFQTTLSLDWALQVLLEATLNTCKSMDDALLLQQSIDKARKAGLGAAATTTLSQRVHEKEAELIDQLVTTETAQVLELCGLGTMATAWKNFQEASAEGGALNSSMAAYPGLSPEEVQDCMKEFYTSLYSPPLPSLEGSIKDPVLRKSARKKIAQRVCTFYRDIYQAIVAEHESGAGGYEDVSFLGHSPDQVSTLFSA